MRLVDLPLKFKKEKLWNANGCLFIKRTFDSVAKINITRILLSVQPIIAGTCKNLRSKKPLHGDFD